MASLDSCLQDAFDCLTGSGDESLLWHGRERRVVLSPAGLDDSFRWLQVLQDEDTDDIEVLDCFGYPVFRDSWIQDHDEWEVIVD